MSYDVTKYTGVDFGFPFEVMSNEVAEKKLGKYCSDLRMQFAPLSKNWSIEYNGEWWTRQYLALKMILSATVMLTSRDFAELNNIKIVGPYLLYYSALSCCRSLVFTLLEQPIGVDLFSMTHQKTINVAYDAVRKVSPNMAMEVKAVMERCRANREMLSYRFPATGTRVFAEGPPGDRDSVIRVCRFLADLVQLRTECFESSLRKNAVGRFDVAEEFIERCFVYDIDGDTVIDEDDWSRIGYWIRRGNTPHNIRRMATDGLLEDWFGAWSSESDDGNNYDPDENIDIVFSF